MQCLSPPICIGMACSLRTAKTACNSSLVSLVVATRRESKACPRENPF